MDFDAFIYLPGNGYNESACEGFLSALRNYFKKPVKFIQLLENKNTKEDYEDLEPKTYSDYIAKSIGSPGKYIMMGISMGCLHIANFSHFYPEWCYPVMIMLEPTICQGIYPLLRAFEAGRGNGNWLKSLKENSEDIEELPANEKVMDIAIDKVNKIPASIRIGMVFTNRNNEDRPYKPQQISAKRKYYEWLSKDHKTYLLHLDSDHCLDTHPKLFPAVIDFISKVIASV